MDLALAVFGKQIEYLSALDLESYFSDPKEESDIVEYKSYYQNNNSHFRENEKAVLRSICAFLNSSGGVLVWGAPKETMEDGIKTYKDGLTPMPYDIDKDSFISKVVNRIVPVPNSVKFARIKLKEEGFVYVIEVNNSEYKPHQFDDRFWMRNDGQTNKAPYHYIEALFKQVKYPTLVGEIAIQGTGAFRPDREYRINFSITVTNLTRYINETNPVVLISVENRSNNLAHDVRVLHYGIPVVREIDYIFRNVEDQVFNRLYVA